MSRRVSSGTVFLKLLPSLPDAWLFLQQLHTFDHASECHKDKDAHKGSCVAARNMFLNAPHASLT
jgi:hypothetical protein